MKKFTFAGADAFLLYYTPNWEESVDCSFSVPSDTTTGLSGKEDRTPLSLSLRTRMDFEILTIREEASEFRVALKELANSPVLVPFWPAQSGYAASDKDGIGGGLWVAWEPGWDTWEVYFDGDSPGSFTPSADAQKAPVLFGRFDKAPSPDAETDEVSSCSISFIENSGIGYALTVGTETFTDGPEINNVAQKMFPLLPNWADGVEAGEAKYTIVKDEVGFGRVTSDTYYDQDGARKTEQSFLCDGWSAVKKMLRFFYDAKGTVGRFWLPLAVSGCRLAAPLEEIPVTNSSDAVPTGFQGEIIWHDSGEPLVNGEKVLYDPTDAYAIWTSTTKGRIISAVGDVGNESVADYFAIQDYPDTITVVGSAAGTADGDMFYEGLLNDFHYWYDGNTFYSYHNFGNWLIGTTPGSPPPEGVLYTLDSVSEIPEKTGWTYVGIPKQPPTLEYTTPAANIFWGKGAFSGTITLSPAFSSELSVDNGIGFGEDSFLALIKGGVASGFEIASNVANVITLVTPPTEAYSPANTSLSPLLLSRFNKDAFEISFVTDSVAIVKSPFIEVPKEYAETDSGATDNVAYLYEFELANYTPWRYTSHEQDITDLTNIWTAQPFEHSDIRENINMEKADVKLTSRSFTGNPLDMFIPLKLESVLYLTIKECSPNEDGKITASPTTIFKGSVTKATTDGPSIEATCSGISALFDRMVPNVLMQPTCNYLVFSPPCGLSAVDWKMNALVVDYPYTVSLGVYDPYRIIIAPPVFPKGAPIANIEIFEHYFAGGKVEVGTGVDFQSRSIMDSVDEGGNITLTLRHPLNGTITEGGTTLNLWAGCDGRRVTCLGYDTQDNEEGKFNNYPRFGGFPFAPIGNPALAKVNKDHSDGGKK